MCLLFIYKQQMFYLRRADEQHNVLKPNELVWEQKNKNKRRYTNIVYPK